MIIESLTLGQVLAPLISGAVAILLYHYLGSDYLGAEENIYWNGARRALLSAGDSTVRKKTNFALTNPAKDSEKVGTVRASSQEFAQLLEENGYVQGVLSGLKYRPDDIDPNTSSQVEFEHGSMVFRESRSDLVPDALAFKQVHVFWFENGDGKIDVYAHYEYSSLNPIVAWKHYRAVDQNARIGKERVRKILQSADLD